MKVTSTDYIIDDSRALIQELYQTRLEDNLTRAYLEIKMYHLPIKVTLPYSKIPQQLPEYAIFSEKHYTHQNKYICQECQQTKPLYGEHASHQKCLECWSKLFIDLWKEFPVKVRNFGQILNTPQYIPSRRAHIMRESWIHQVVAATQVELVSAVRALLRFHPKMSSTVDTVWTTPKKAFMAMEYGCIMCGKKHPHDQDWMWSAQLPGWTNGYCPNCCDMDRSLPNVWGLSLEKYYAWQDEYTTAMRMHRTIARYGALSLLLVNTTPQWVHYIANTVPHNAQASAALYYDTSRPAIGRIFPPVRAAKSLRDLKLNVKDILNNVS